MKIDFVTGNAQKFEEATHILENWELGHVNLDLKEIQGEIRDIITEKTKEALKISDKPLIVEDTCLCCPAIGNLPGPYIKDFLRKIDDIGLYDMINKYDDKSAKVICTVGYIKPGMDEPILFEGTINGKIVPPKGETRHGKYSWNRIFMPEGYNKTFGEMTIKEHSECSHRRLALLKFKEYLEEQKKND